MTQGLLREAAVTASRWRVLAVALLALLCAVAAAAQILVGGEIESTSEGFEFPDASVQTTTAGAYAQVVVVSSTGGDHPTIQVALDAILDAVSTKRYLVQIGPGTYSEQVVMKPFVDLRGASEELTEITWVGASDTDSPTLTCASDTRLSDLSVTNTGADAYAIAILCDGSSPVIERLSVDAATGSTGSRGIELRNGSSASLRQVDASASGSGENNAIRMFLADSPRFRDVTASAVGGDKAYGIRIDDGTPRLWRVRTEGRLAGDFNAGILVSGAALDLADSEATAESFGTAVSWAVSLLTSTAEIRRGLLTATADGDSYALHLSSPAGGPVIVNHSELDGGTAAVITEPVADVYIAGTKIIGGVDTTTFGGSATCAGVYDGVYGAFASTCP